jgi:hypothetical protein
MAIELREKVSVSDGAASTGDLPADQVEFSAGSDGSLNIRVFDVQSAANTTVLSYKTPTPDAIVFPKEGVLKIYNAADPSKVFGTISHTDLRLGLNITDVENVAVDKMVLSKATKDALLEKHSLIEDSPTKRLPQSHIEGFLGVGGTLDLLATKDQLNNLSASVSLGIKYEYTTLAAMLSNTTAVVGEQAVLVLSDSDRDVYTWTGATPSWTYTYKLSGTHTHDAYYDKKKVDDALLPYYNDLTKKIQLSDVVGLAGTTGVLAGKVDNARVLKDVPATAQFTDEKWAGEAQMRSDFNSLKAVVDTSSYSDTYRRTVKTFSGAWIEIAPNVKYRIDSDGDGSAVKFFNWQKEGKVRIQRVTDFPHTDTLRYGTSWLYDDDIKSNAYGYITWSGVSNWRDMDGDTYSYVTEYMRVEWERDGVRMTKVIKLEINCNELNDKRRTYTINTTVYGDQFKQA